MRILLIVSSFNSLSQKVFCYLQDLNHIVSVQFPTSDEEMIKEVKRFSPDLVLCPYLKQFIPKEIFLKVPTFIIHPGIRGDRGYQSLDNAIKQDLKTWGVVILKANEEVDGGDIYGEETFVLRDTFKASIYRNEVSSASLKAIDTLFKNLEDESFEPLPQILNPISKVITQEARAINWEKDITEEIIKKIYYSDSFPGVKDEFFGITCYLFGAWRESDLKGQPKEIVAKRDGAICVGTVDGAIWISHLKEEGRFKLPATYVLKEKIQGVKEIRNPLILDLEKETFHEIRSQSIGEIGYLYFNFHNGAMTSDQCIRLKYAFKHLSESCKVIVLMGGEDFFSNGIHLNILEDSKKQGEDGWSNINSMNDLVKSILFAENVLTIASFGANAGAGGVFL
ncbi:MAG: formyltransferase family protein, partial [Campylobacterales bacterium]|nr:formyltransferase family protein [Campylobacterales bacterium]